MFKGAQDNTSYLTRTGSHSTKGSRGGVVEVLPPGAKELEHEYQTYKQYVETLTGELVALQNVLSKRGATQDQKQRFHSLQAELVAAKEVARAAGVLAYAEVFMHVADKLLPTSVIARLSRETDELIGRVRYEVKAPKTRNKTESVTRGRKNNQRRVRLRERLAKEQKKEPAAKMN